MWLRLQLRLWLRLRLRLWLWLWLWLRLRLLLLSVRDWKCDVHVLVSPQAEELGCQMVKKSN